MSEYLKLGTAAIGALMVVGGLFQGVVAMTGGSIPFWASKRDFDLLKDRFDKWVSEELRQQCFDANRRLRNARARVAAEPSNAVEQYIVEATRKEIFILPGCDQDP